MRITSKILLLIFLQFSFLNAQEKDKGFDILHYKLNLDLYDCFIEPFPHSFKGFIEIKIKAENDLTEIYLDASNSSITIDSIILPAQSFIHPISQSKALIRYSHNNGKLNISFNSTINKDDSLIFAIYYSHLNVRDNSFFSDNGMVFTNNAPEGARNWFPCYDHPSDKATFELIAKTPNNVLLGSNGSLIDSTQISDTTFYHWKSRDPIATYLTVISAKVDYKLDIVEWNNLETKENIPVRFYWNEGENESNLNSIKKQIIPIMDFFSGLFGTYPFEKNGFATLNEHFVYGGMENQTLISLCPNCWEEMLIVHEFAHTWCGNMITLENWSDVWLNESFATYCEGLWIEHNWGLDAYKSYFKNESERYFRENPGFPIYNILWNEETPPSNILYNGPIIYSKGACILYMFRETVGDSLFFEVLKSYSGHKRFRYANASTEDFISVVNKITGQDYTKYFYQWLRTSDHPVYQNYYVITEDEGEWRIDLTINQVQDNETTYELEIKLKIIFSDGTEDVITIKNTKRAENYFFTYKNDPLVLQFDPYNEIILKESETIKIDAIEITY